MWCVIAAIGIGLEVVGLCVAIDGFVITYRDNLGSALWRDLATDIQQWFMVTILRRPRQRTVRSVGTSLALEWAMSGFPITRPPALAADASAEERLAYVERLVAILAEESTTTREVLEGKIKSAEERLGKKVHTVRQQLGETERRVESLHEAVIGRDGAGLRRATLGLSITLAGVVMSFAGLAA